MTPERITLDNRDLVRRYVAGESVNRLAARYGVSRNVINVRLDNAGVPRRGRGEAERVKWAGMSAPQRARQVAAAHEARRNTPDPESAKIARAHARARKGGFDSEHERCLHDLLLERGVVCIPQFVVGPYVCDLGAPPVAVEVFGGNWHWSGRHLRRLAARVDYLFDAAFHVLVVQQSVEHPITGAPADYVVAYVEAARRNPAAWREYRVVRGAGEVIARARSDADDRTLVPAFRVSRNAAGQYVSVAR